MPCQWIVTSMPSIWFSTSTTTLSFSQTCMLGPGIIRLAVRIPRSTPSANTHWQWLHTVLVAFGVHTWHALLNLWIEFIDAVWSLEIRINGESWVFLVQVNVMWNCMHYALIYFHLLNPFCHLSIHLWVQHVAQLFVCLFVFSLGVIIKFAEEKAKLFWLQFRARLQGQPLNKLYFYHCVFAFSFYLFFMFLFTAHFLFVCVFPF